MRNGGRIMGKMFKWLLGGIVLLGLVGFAATFLRTELAIRAVAQAPAGDRLSINWSAGRDSLQPVIDVFTEVSGIDVEVTEAHDIYNTDVILISDVGTLLHAKRGGFLSYMRTPARDAVVPPRYRDRDGMWYAVALRARAVVYNRETVDPDTLTSWADLADPKWQGRLCLDTSGTVQNRSMVAMMLRHWGERRTNAWLEGVMANLKDGAGHDFRADPANMTRVATGECDLTFLDTHHIGHAAAGHAGPEQRAASDLIGVTWVSQDFATPMNVVGVGLNPGTRFRVQAELLVDFFLSPRGQALLSEHLNTYPLRPDVALSEWLVSYGSVPVHEVDLNDLESLYTQAITVMEAAGWPRGDTDHQARARAQERQRKAPINPVLYP